MMKHCPKCHKDLPTSEFHRNKAKKDGLGYVCKICRKEEHACYYEAHKVQCLAVYRQYYRRNRAAMLAKEAAREKSPEGRWQRRAYSHVQRAKVKGELVPALCAHCGAANVEAHHDDYSRPLDVIWLCRRCHAGRHSFRPLRLRSEK